LDTLPYTTLFRSYSFTRSSNIGRLNLDASLNYSNRKYDGALSANSVYTSQNKAISRDRENASFSNFYIMNPWWSLGAIFGYQRNLELGLLRRYQEAVGIRYNLLYENNIQIRMLSGLVINQEKNLRSIKLEPQYEIPLSVNLNFFKFEKPNISISTSQTVYVSLTRAGRVRYDGEARVSWEMIKDLSLNLNFYHSYDSKPVSISATNFDYGIVLGLKYAF
jgi:hypothetical protein